MPRLKHFDVVKIVVLTFLEDKILDDQTIKKIGEELNETAASLDHQQILILSMRNVVFFTSAALGELITLKKLTDPKGIQLKIVEIHKDVWEVFQTLKLHLHFDCFPDDSGDDVLWKLLQS